MEGSTEGRGGTNLWIGEHSSEHGRKVCWKKGEKTIVYFLYFT